MCNIYMPILPICLTLCASGGRTVDLHNLHNLHNLHVSLFRTLQIVTNTVSLVCSPPSHLHFTFTSSRSNYAWPS